ncbi:selenocysteine lyase/cysteine desulfurase [Phyllobacterium trifolii]|uniref:Selenocysteine lyase/cysteine desulfurase n=1 Tax=Phyllobacterium trifolii TaxID=300193 RepID=A0A839UC22_9HYPH|nr:aminotransferase class V-fold PLP-dependent enzyme [Phyllobacterium trifolii]MBB3148538.1 selenocysteine lyase/cysteine desulfurase [Phyllobacterium trifolii]
MELQSMISLGSPKAPASSKADVAKDWENFRSAFPTAKNYVYLDTARKALVPYWTEAAMQEWTRDVYDNAGSEAFSMDNIDKARHDVADMVGANPANLSLIKNTSEGVNIVAHGIDLRKGDNVVLSELEHENNTFPWRYLEFQGVEARIIKADADGRVPFSSYVEAIDGRTRVVSVAWVSYGSGHRGPTHELAELAHKTGAILLVDAIQACGILDQRIDELGADVVVSGGHKTMLSLAGAGFMYVRPGLIDKILPPYASKFSFTSIDRKVANLELASDGHRFEYGNPNFVGVWCQRRSARIIRAVGLSRIEARVQTLSDRLIAGLKQQKAELKTSDSWSERCGIVTIAPRGSAQSLEKRLKEKGILVAEKDDLLRISLYAYNNEDDVDKILSVLPEL